MPITGGDANIMYRVAVHNINALQVMYDVDGYHGDTASSNNPTTAQKILGVVISSTSAGGVAPTVRQGEYDDPMNSLTPGPLFLGIGGVIQSVPPTSGVLVRIGFASSISKAIIDVQQTIVLA
jgi:hypothetical protein